jgi:hypothetical protein
LCPDDTQRVLSQAGSSDVRWHHSHAGHSTVTEDVPVAVQFAAHWTQLQWPGLPPWQSLLLSRPQDSCKGQASVQNLLHVSASPLCTFVHNVRVQAVLLRGLMRSFMCRSLAVQLSDLSTALTGTAH